MNLPLSQLLGWRMVPTMNTTKCLGRLALLLFVLSSGAALAQPTTPSTNTVRVAAAQAARRVVDFRLQPDEALAAVEKNLTDLERIIQRAGEAKCDALVLPEDTPGLLNWVGANETLAKELLPKAVNRMLEQLGRAAARHKMYLVVCSDLTESDGATYNTAFLRWCNLQHSVPARPRRQGDWTLSQGLPDLVGGGCSPAGKQVPGFSHA
jgi:hypothetical protein